MAVLDLLFGTQKTPTHMGYEENGELYGVLQLDAAISITHNYTSQVTQNEVEEPVDGTNKINDNVVLDPEKLQITGLISEAPLSLVDAIRNLGGGLLANVNPALGAATNFLSSELMASKEDRQQNALAQLLALRENKIPFTIVTGLRRYENMMVTNISLPQDPKLGKSLRFSIDCVKVKIVESQTVLIPASKVSNNVKHTATSKTSGGKQSTTPASPEEATRGQSILSRVTGFGI